MRAVTNGEPLSPSLALPGVDLGSPASWCSGGVAAQGRHHTHREASSLSQAHDNFSDDSSCATPPQLLSPSLAYSAGAGRAVMPAEGGPGACDIKPSVPGFAAEVEVTERGSRPRPHVIEGLSHVPPRMSARYVCGVVVLHVCLRMMC